MKAKLLVNISNIGEVLVVIGAIFWIAGWELVNYIFTLGTILFALGRLLEKHPETHNIALRRLYIQRIIGVVILIFAALLMFFYRQLNGYEISEYQIHATSSAWLLPFIIFVLIEIYTAFRIPSELKKEEQ